MGGSGRQQPGAGAFRGARVSAIVRIRSSTLALDVLLLHRQAGHRFSASASARDDMKRKPLTRVEGQLDGWAWVDAEVRRAVGGVAAVAQQRRDECRYVAYRRAGLEPRARVSQVTRNSTLWETGYEASV